MTATAPATRTSDSPILGSRDMSPSISDAGAGAFAPNFHSADDHDTIEIETETETNIKPITTPRHAPSSEPQSKEVSPSASPRIRISFKGGSSEPESPASMARDVPPSSSAQPSDSNSNSSAHTSASEAPSLPATTINTAATGSGSISATNIAPLSPSRRPFSFRDVSDINEPSQIRVQSARLHHDAYDPKKSCACCERQREPEKDKDKEKEKDKDSEIKRANESTAKPHADTNGTTKSKTTATATSPTSATVTAPASSSSPRAAKSSPWFGLCGICIAIRNCLAPEDMEYRCSHGRPCSHPKHRHSKGC